MVNFQDPAVVLHDDVILSNFWHFVHGLYIWEFITTLDYELDIIRGRRSYRRTIWIYSLTRAATLVATILSFIGFDVTARINCQVWLVFLLIFSYFGVAMASLLIVLRIIAIWNKNRIIVTISVGVWLVNVAFIIQGIVRLRSTWNPVRRTCTAVNTEESKLNIIVTFVSDIVLLLPCSLDCSAYVAVAVADPVSHDYFGIR
ncbi:hypothetical protein BC827DRAFT_897028 [Russula dissimulans]|nr:hypothetical protein BC827DRAFT_897028 [Russula dissimulans]